MPFTIVTISFNQAEFLSEAIESVLSQLAEDDEYIVVDAGSTDGSREIITSYGTSIKSIFESDEGPADGLNKGFRNARGEWLAYLNADDKLCNGALAELRNAVTTCRSADVFYGHAVIIDRSGSRRRLSFSDPFDLRKIAYGCCVIMQPSTFIRSSAFRKTNGFNVQNKSNWDGELLVDLALSGAQFKKIGKILSCYRVHGQSITGTGRMSDQHKKFQLYIFERILGRPPVAFDSVTRLIYRTWKHLSSPRAAWERLSKGSIFGRGDS